MSEIKFTAEQELARTVVGRDVLLTAAAGAGKTAVLAQRCVYLLCDADEPCDVEELLVLTFTEAAASEMRERIGQYLRKKCKAEPANADLRRKLALLDKANISTIHAFCKSLLTEFFYVLGLDPTFEMMDADESNMLKGQVAEELFEGRYASETSDVFGGFVQAYGAAKAGDDHAAVGRLVQMNNFLESLRDHQGWAASCRERLGGDG